MKLSNFLREMFGLGETYKIRRLKTVEDANDVSSTVNEAKRLHYRYSAIIFVTRLLGAAFLISLLAIVLFAIMDKNSPQILSQILFATLGYFGGAFARFMGFSEKEIFG